MSATGTQQAGRQDLEELRTEGVGNPYEFMSLSPEAIAEALRRWRADRGAGVGALVERLRLELRRSQRRGYRAPQGRSTYVDDVYAWLAKHFPDLICSTGRVHYAAATAVMRHHAQKGRGTLTVAEHGPMIRGAVERWMRECNCDMNGNELPEDPDAPIELVA